MYSKRTIRAILKKVAVSSIYKVANESGIAYSTISGWLEKDEKKLKNKAEKSSLQPGCNRIVYFTKSFKISGKIINGTVIYLIIAHDLISGAWIFCFTQSEINAAKRFLEALLKSRLDLVKGSKKTESEDQRLSLDQLRYQMRVKFNPFIGMLSDCKSLHDLLTAGSSFYRINQLQANDNDFWVEPFIITDFNQNKQPVKIVTLGDNALGHINQSVSNAGELSLNNIINTTLLNITKDDLIALEPLTLFKHKGEHFSAAEQPAAKSEEPNNIEEPDNSPAVIKIQFKKIFSQTTDLPGFLIVAYDIKRGSFNFCFTFEKNKSNKTLYLLYLNHFYKSYGMEQPQFAVDLNLADINRIENIDNEAAVNWNIRKIVMQLQNELAKDDSKADLIIKSSVFLAKSNPDLSSASIIHPPFILEEIISTFDFNKNQLLLNQFSLDVHSSIIRILQQKDLLLKNKIEKEKLLKLYSFFKNQKIDYPQLDDKIIEESDVLLLTGDLPQSELILELMLKNSLLNSRSRGKLYVSCGVQKFITGDSRSAGIFFKKAITESRLSQDLTTEFEALRNISGLYMYQGMAAKGYRFLRIAQKIINTINDNTVFTRFHFLLGHYYYNKNLFKQANVQFKNSADYAHKAGLENDYTNSIIGIANCLLKLNCPKQALKYAKKASERFLSSNLRIPLAVCYLTYAQCLAALKRYKEAADLMREQLEVLKTTNYPALEFQGWLYYIKLLLLQGDKAKAGEAFKELNSKTYLTEIEIANLQKSYADLKKELIEKRVD